MHGNGCLWSSDAYQQCLSMQERSLYHVCLSHPHDNVRTRTSEFYCFIFQTRYVDRDLTHCLSLHHLTKTKNMIIHTKKPNTQKPSIFRRVRKISETDCKLRHVCPSVRMKQFGSHGIDFHEIWHLSIFRKSVVKIQVSLKSDINNTYFTWRRVYIYDKVSLDFS